MQRANTPVSIDSEAGLLLQTLFLDFTFCRCSPGMPEKASSLKSELLPKILARSSSRSLITIDCHVHIKLTPTKESIMPRRNANAKPATTTTNYKNNNNNPPSDPDRDPVYDPDADADAFETINPLAPMSTQNANGHPPTHSPSAPSQIHKSSPLPPVSPMYLPGGPRSLPAIALRSFALGCTFSLSAILAVQLALQNIYLWRIPSFTATLALFHYLEFDMTARFNPGDAKVDSFLLSANGRGYNAAHACALLECAVRGVCRAKGWGLHWWPSLRVSSRLPLTLGFVLILTGQTSRSLAMATAGRSFNHLVQSTKRDDHVLITSGIYAWSRHPSYFGFFWWGLGTQLVMGNWVCFCLYAGVLWAFFKARIRAEERYLVGFFGESYVKYREEVGLGIPGIG